MKELRRALVGDKTIKEEFQMIDIIVLRNYNWVNDRRYI